MTDSVLSLWHGHIPKRKTMRQWCASVAADHGVSVAEMMSDRRQANLVRARHEAMYLIRHHTSFSYPQIGAHFKRDHTTILHGVRQHEERMAQAFAMED